MRLWLVVILGAVLAGITYAAHELEVRATGSGQVARVSQQAEPTPIPAVRRESILGGEEREAAAGGEVEAEAGDDGAVDGEDRSAALEAGDDGAAAESGEAGEAPSPQAESETSVRPTFDVVSVDPDGTAVVAGRAAPGSEVTLQVGDRPMGTAIADDRGEWVIVPDELIPGGSQSLSLEATLPDSGEKVRSDQVATIVLPDSPGAEAAASSGAAAPATPVPAGAAEVAGSAPVVPAAESAAPAGEVAVADATPAPAPVPAPAAEAEPAPAATIGEVALADATPAPAPTPAPAAEAEPAPAATIGEVAAADATPAPTPAPAAEAEPAPAAPIGEVAVADATPAPAPRPTAGAEAAGNGVAAEVARSEPSAATVTPEPSGATQAGTETAAKALTTPAPPAPGQAQQRQEPPAVDAASVAAAAQTPEPASTERPEPAAPVVVVTEPGMPSRVLQRADRASGETPPITFDSVDYDDSGHVIVAGQVEAGADVRAYIDNELLGDARADSQGRWTLRATRHIEPGAYELRVDRLDQSGLVIARAGAPFERVAPEIIARARQRGEVVIQPGDNLWNIARAIYGRGIHYTVIYNANTNQIADPDLIYPGQLLVTPGSPGLDRGDATAAERSEKSG
jgi:nucleoid-associated protein YgaU